MNHVPSSSPLLYSYLKKYQEDPSSRVFAPLAEAYRKAGLIAEAIEIAQEGLKLHPEFVSGRVALARALFDQQNYTRVCDELKQVVRDSPDNLVAQRLFAESSLMLGRPADALSSYKMLLYYHPTDADTARMVFELEALAYEKGNMILQTDFTISSAQKAIQSEPHVERERIKNRWVQKIERLQSLLIKLERHRLD